jgi:hypothetical protein
VKIPAASEDRITALFTLEDAAFSRIELALRSAQAGVSSRQIVELAVGAAADIDEDTVRAAMSGAFELYRVCGNRGIPKGVFITELAEAAKVAATEQLREAGQNEARFADRLSKILDFGAAFEIAAKMRSLSGEHERTFCTATVLTDIRPIFHTNPADPPVGGIIAHTLSISYHAGPDGGLETTFINLSEMNISGLIAKLERAKLKGRTLATLVTKAGLVPVSGDHYHED